MPDRIAESAQGPAVALGSIWDETLHPRGRGGRFVTAVRKLHRGQTAHLPGHHDVKVHRTLKGDEYVVRAHDQREVMPTPEAAAGMAVRVAKGLKPSRSDKIRAKIHAQAQRIVDKAEEIEQQNPVAISDMMPTVGSKLTAPEGTGSSTASNPLLGKAEHTMDKVLGGLDTHAPTHAEKLHLAPHGQAAEKVHGAAGHAVDTAQARPHHEGLADPGTWVDPHNVEQGVGLLSRAAEHLGAQTSDFVMGVLHHIPNAADWLASLTHLVQAREDRETAARLHDTTAWARARAREVVLQERVEDEVIRALHEAHLTERLSAWDAKLHPRDRKGRWSETVGAIARDSGQTRKALRKAFATRSGMADPGTGPKTPRARGAHINLPAMIDASNAGALQREVSRAVQRMPDGGHVTVGGVTITRHPRNPRKYVVQGGTRTDGAPQSPQGDFPDSAASVAIRRAREDRDTVPAAAKPVAKARTGKAMYSHQLPDGSVATRESARSYTHVTTSVGHPDSARGTGARRVLSFHGSEAAALKAKADYERRGFQGVQAEKIQPPKGHGDPGTPLRDPSAPKVDAGPAGPYGGFQARREYTPWPDQAWNPSPRFKPLPDPKDKHEAWAQTGGLAVMLRADIGKQVMKLDFGKDLRLPEGTLVTRLGANQGFRIDGPTGTYKASTFGEALTQAQAEEGAARAHRFGNSIPGNPMGPLSGVDIAPIDPVGEQIGGMLHGGWVTLPHGTLVHRKPGDAGKGDTFEVIGTDGHKEAVPATDKDSTIRAAKAAEDRASKSGGKQTEAAQRTTKSAGGGPLVPLNDNFIATRKLLHRISTQMMGAARQPSNEIAVLHTPGGFGTPWYVDGDVRSRLRVENGRLVREQGSKVVTESIPGVDHDSAVLLGNFYSVANSAIGELKREFPDEKSDRVADRAVTPANIWPEHFDMGTEMGADTHRANFGASPGDINHDEPYFYVGPWAGVPEPGPLWNAKGFQGAELSYKDVLAAPDQREAILDFYRSRLRALRAKDPATAAVADGPVMADPGTPSAQIGATPFRGAGAAQGSDYYDTTRWKGYANAVPSIAEAHGLTVTKLDPVDGVWDGGGEPSSRIEVDSDDPIKVASVMDEIGARYNQDGVIGFIPGGLSGHSDPGHDTSVRVTSGVPVDPSAVKAALKKYPAIPGATVRADGRLEVIFMPHEFETDDEAAVGMDQIVRLFDNLGVDYGYARGRGILRLAGRDYAKRGNRPLAEAGSGVRGEAEGGGGDEGRVGLGQHHDSGPEALL